MKRLSAMLLAAAMLLTMLSSCAAPAVEGTTHTATKAKSTDKRAFDAATHDLSLALACALRTAADPEQVHSPSVMWNVSGWYCALRANRGDEEVLTADCVEALQYALNPGRPFSDIPDYPLEYDHIFAKKVENERAYGFPACMSAYHMMIEEKYETAVENFSADTVAVTFTAKADGEQRIYLFSFQKDENASAIFPYVLSSVILPSSGEKSDEAVTCEKLFAANSVTGLLRKYSTIGIKSTHADQSTNQQYLFSKNGVIAEVSKYTAADGEKTYSGHYGNYAFVEEDDHCTASVCLVPESKAYAFDYEIAGMIAPGTVRGLSETENTYSFYICPDFAEDETESEDETEPAVTEETNTAAVEATTAAQARGEDAAAAPAETSAAEETTVSEEATVAEETTAPETNYEPGTVDVYYVVDKSTLALQKAVWNMGTEYEYTVELSYGCEVNEYQLTDSWEELREITFVCSMVDEDGANYEEVFKYSVPGDLELVPSSFKELVLSDNAENTGAYAYPGNGEDYVVYVTNAAD